MGVADANKTGSAKAPSPPPPSGLQASVWTPPSKLKSSGSLPGPLEPASPPVKGLWEEWAETPLECLISGMHYVAIIIIIIIMRCFIDICYCQ